MNRHEFNLIHQIEYSSTSSIAYIIHKYEAKNVTVITLIIFTMNNKNISYLVLTNVLSKPSQMGLFRFDNKISNKLLFFCTLSINYHLHVIDKYTFPLLNDIYLANILCRLNILYKFILSP